MACDIRDEGRFVDPSELTQPPESAAGLNATPRQLVSWFRTWMQRFAASSEVDLDRGTGHGTGSPQGLPVFAVSRARLETIGQSAL